MKTPIGFVTRRQPRSVPSVASDEAPAEERPAAACVAGERNERQSSSLRALMKTSPGTSTRPIDFIFFLPSFCFSSSLRLRVMSPP
jgi:hypothetical protein